MSDFKFTRYFEEKVLKKRAYLKKEWCVRVVEDPLKVEPQEHNRFRFLGRGSRAGRSDSEGDHLRGQADHS